MAITLQVALGSTTRKLALITVFDEGQSKWEAGGKKYNTAITDIPISGNIDFS